MPPESLAQDPAPVAAPRAAAQQRIPFARLAAFSRFFADYASGDARALAFFAHDWRSAEARDRAAGRAAAASRDRHTLALVLTEQNTRWRNDGERVEANLQALRQPGSAAVVTGQQLGLFGGPLYTLYKAVTALQLAAAETRRTGRPVVPVFWLAGEDHDWDEVRSASIVRRGEVATVALPPDDSRQPVGRRIVGADVQAPLAALAEALPPTGHTAEMLAAVADCYRPEATHRDAFARWMAHLFRGTGLVLMSVDDPRLKRLAGPIIRRELEHPEAPLAAILDASGALEAAGYHRQVSPLAGNLFLMDEGGRVPLDPQPGGGYALRGRGITLSQEDLLARLADDPGAFSPNVALRPIVEDALLPTMAYVAGPGEAAYYAQLRGVYDHFGVPMPVVYPRASATILSPAARRVLERYDLDFERLAGAPDAGSEEARAALYRGLALASGDHGIEEAIASAAAELDAVADSLRPLAERVDPSLARSAESFRTGIRKELARLETKLVRAEKRRHHQIDAHLTNLFTEIFPAGAPQERVASVVDLLNRQGTGVVERLLQNLSLDTGEHQVLAW
jgi:bacillithiol synthase